MSDCAGSRVRGYGEGGRGEHGGFKSRDVLVHSCESASCGGGERARGTRVCGIACGGKIKRTRSVPLGPAVSPFLSLSASPCCLSVTLASTSSSSLRRLLSLHGRARALSQTRATSFSLLRTRVAVVASLFLFPSFPATTRHRFSLVLCLLPSLFVRRRAASDPRRRVSIIADKFNFHLITTRPLANVMKLDL